MKDDLDLNLLVVLDALLRTQSVTNAATELCISTPAASRGLARLRKVFNDPLLVRSGRYLVPTPRAIELREQVANIVESADSLISTRKQLDIENLSRTFTILASESAICAVAQPLLQILKDKAPNTKVFFINGGPTDLSLRNSKIDMEIGAIRNREVETHVDHLFSDCLIAVVRRENPILEQPVTIESYCKAEHVLHSRSGSSTTVIDRRLAKLGMSRHVVTSVPSLSSLLYLIRHTDLVGTCFKELTNAQRDSLDLEYFDIPGMDMQIDIDLTWHPRYTDDAAHKWMRDQIKSVFATIRN